MMEFINEILTGDNVEIMRSMPDNYVDLTVTSPPYDGLRTYNGYSFDFENVAKELHRITKDGGVVVWVVGDATVKGSESGTSFRQALYFKEIGFNLHDTMIWEKFGVPAYDPRNMRYKQGFEYMFILSKGKPSTYNPIADVPVKRKGVKGATRKNVDGSTRKHPDIVFKPFQDRKNVWLVDTGYMRASKDKIAFQHPAIFPEQLANDHIVSWSNPGDIVFDPFGGSGTTAKMAILNDRNYIHIDVSAEYNGIAQRRIDEALASKNIG